MQNIKKYVAKLPPKGVITFVSNASSGITNTLRKPKVNPAVPNEQTEGELVPAATEALCSQKCCTAARKLAEKTPITRFENPAKYFVEYYRNETEAMELGSGDFNLTLRHAVMISQCENLEVIITTKINKLEIDGCSRVKVRLPGVLSSIDIQNSNACEVKVEQYVPGITIDSSESVRIYVPESNVESIEIASSGGGSAELVSVPEADHEDEDDVEPTTYAIPFQYVHTVVGGSLVSKVSPLYTH